MAVAQLGAMSEDELKEFKRELQRADTSIAMTDAIANLGYQKNISFNTGSWEIDFAISSGFFISGVDDLENLNNSSPEDPLIAAVIEALDDCLASDLHPFIFKNADISTISKRFEKYTWACSDVCEGVTHIVKRLRGTPVTSVITIQDAKDLKNFVAEHTGEMAILGGKNDFSERYTFFMEKYGFKVKMALGIFGGSAILAALYAAYCAWCAKPDDEQEPSEDLTKSESE